MPADTPRWHLLRTLADLRDLEPAWRELCLADPRSTPFQRPEWLLPWWNQFAPAPDALRVLHLADGPRSLALLPLYLYPDPTTGEQQLQLLGVGTSDYLDALLHPTCTPAHLAQGLKLLLTDPTWDTLHASQLRPGSPLATALSTLATIQYSSESTSRMPAVSLAQLPVKIRRNAMYYRNAAARQGTLIWRLSTAADLPAVYDTFVRLHTARWHAAGEPGVLADPLVLAWHREALPLLLAAGLLRLGTLCLDDRPIAALLSFIDPPEHPTRTQYLYLTAFDHAARALRPGTLLLALAIEHAALEGVHTIDMLRGDEPYKSLWHVERTPTLGFVLPRAALHEAHPA